MTMGSTEGLPKPREIMSGQPGAFFSNAPNFRCSAIAAVVRSP
jgi:hypothetical protein